MTIPSLTQIKTAVQNLSPRERIALREFLDDFKDYEELDAVIQEFRTASPMADWEDVIADVDTAVAETRNDQAHRRK